MREDGVQATYEHALEKAGGWEAILAGRQPAQHALERAFRKFFDKPARRQPPPEVLYNALASSVGYAGSGLVRRPVGPLLVLLDHHLRKIAARCDRWLF